MKKTAAIILSMAMAITLFVGTGITAFATTGGGGTVTSSNNNEYEVPDDPVVSLFSFENKVFQAGDILAVPMVVTVEEGYAQNVRMTLEGPKDYENDFSFYSSSGAFKTDDISDKTAINPFIQVSPSVPDGTYKVKINFNYTRIATSFKSSSEMIITVHGRSQNVIRVNKAAFEATEIGIDNKSVLNVELLNPSDSDYRNVSLSLNSSLSKGFTLYQNFLPSELVAMGSKQKNNFKFYVYVDSTVTTGNHILIFDLSYKNHLGDIVTSREQVPVQVKRSADASGKGNVPRIIVSNYKTDVEQIQAGKEFTLDFSLKNTSATTTVRNIKVVLSSSTSSGAGTGAGAGTGTGSSDVFFAAAGSNSFYIPSIAPGASTSQTIKLMSKQDVEPGVYSVHLKIDYEDETGNTVPSADEQISFSVSQEQRLEVQSMNIPTDGTTGSPLPINFQYINKGKSTIYNLSVTVEGDFTMEGGSQYIGNLTAGYNDYFDSAITPMGEGSQKGSIVLTFEDLNGDTKEHRTEFTCNVMSMGDIGGDIGGGMNGGMIGGDIGTVGPMMPEQQGGNSLIWWIGIPVVVLLVGGIITVIVLKKRKAKKVMVEDEED